MISPPFPDTLANVWEWFHELHLGRGYGQHGPNPLSYVDIKNWSDLMDVHPLPREVLLIKRIDQIFLENR